MKIRTTHLGISLLACFTLFISVGFVSPAHAQTYYLRSFGGVSGSPPLPFDPYEGAEPIITLDAAKQIYQIQDDTNAYALLVEAHQLDAMSASASSADSPPTPDDGTNSSGGDFTNNFQPLVFGPNDLVIQITNVDIVNQQATLFLTNTIPDNHYQLLSTNTLANAPWTLGEVITGAAGTNVTPFSTFNIGTNSQMFFRGHHANPEIAIQFNANAIEPNPATSDPGQVGKFFVQSYYQLSNDLPVYYSIGGTASNGVDYQNLNGVITVPANGNQAFIDVVPLNDNRVDGAESVTLTLSQTNSYLIDPFNSSATIYVEDSSQTVSVTTAGNSFDGNGDACEPNGPPGAPVQDGAFDFHRTDERNTFPDLVAYFVISGTASNGVDYTFITNTVDFTNGITDVFVTVNPLAQTVFDGTESVIVTLVPTNTYLVDTNGQNSASLNIFDSSTTVTVDFVQDAIETNATTSVGQPGIFAINRSDVRNLFPPMTVKYTLSGTATNGVDYQLLSGSVTFADGATSTNIFINTIEQDLIEPDETVILTLATNGTAYYVGTPFQTNLTLHTTVGFGTVVGNLNAPVGLDYYEPSNGLIVSVAGPELFDLIHTNNGSTNVVKTVWSGASGVSEETYLAIPRIPAGVFTNSAGFTNGTMFFGSDTNVGFVAPGGTNFNLDWANLTNPIVTNSLLLRGGFCMDQTGAFSNRLIVVTSSDNGDDTIKGVWSVDAHAKPRLINQIQTKHLEGVAVLTNDVQRWGPWAGKIITGDEDASELFAVDTNGVTPIDTHSLVSGGFPPENVQVIPPNSSLYVADNGNSAIMELPATYFRNHVGDLLVGDSFEGGGSGGFFILHWNTQGSNFVTTPIPMFGNSLSSILEGTTFAPVQLPNH